MIAKKNYYDVLEVELTATNKEIEEAYKRAYNSYSGDSVAMYSLMSKEECDEILNQIEEAYTILGDPRKREEYDKARGFSRKPKNEDNLDFQFNSNNESNVIREVNKFPKEEYSEESTYGLFDYKPQTSKPMQSTFETNQNTNQTFDYEPKRNAKPLSDLISETQDLATEMKKDVSTNKDKFLYNEATQKNNEADVSKFSALKKFNLEFINDPEFEQKIENTTEFNGNILKDVREYKNVSIERLSEMTRISKTYIRHIEDDDYNKLPADVYTRGFVYQIAKCLKLNPNLVATSYLHNLKIKRTGISSEKSI